MNVLPDPQDVLAEDIKLMVLLEALLPIELTERINKFTLSHGTTTYSVECSHELEYYQALMDVHDIVLSFYRYPTNITLYNIYLKYENE